MKAYPAIHLFHHESQKRNVENESQKDPWYRTPFGRVMETPIWMSSSLTRSSYATRWPWLVEFGTGNYPLTIRVENAQLTTSLKTGC